MRFDPSRETDAPRVPARLVVGIVGAALVVHVVLAWLGRPPGILTGQDDAQYLMLAQSLRHGGYQETFRVDHPVHALYPPGYPAMLALWGWPFGDRYDALVALGVLLSATSLLLLFLALRRCFPQVVALTAVVLLAVNPDLTRIGGTLSSEIGYLAASVLALFFLARTDPGSRPVAGNGRWMWFAGLAAILASLTRVVGVILLGAIALHWALERRWRAVGWLALASAATVGAWLAWSAIAPDQHVGVSYAADVAAGLRNTEWVRPLPGRIPGNITFYSARLLLAFGAPNIEGTALDSWFALLVLATPLGVGLVTMVGVWRPATLYGLGYLGLLSVWTWAEARYLVPLEVVIVPAILVGAFAIARRYRPAWAAPATAGFAVMLGLTAAVRSTEQAKRYADCDRNGAMPPPACLTPDQASFFEALRWVRDHTAEGDVVLTAKYAPFFYYTARRTVSYRGALARDAAGFLPFLTAAGATRILLTNLLDTEFRRLAPRLAANCRRLAVERHFPPQTYLFVVRSPEDSTDGGAACGAIEGYQAANRDRRY